MERYEFKIRGFDKAGKQTFLRYITSRHAHAEFGAVCQRADLARVELHRRIASGVQRKCWECAEYWPAAPLKSEEVTLLRQNVLVTAAKAVRLASAAGEMLDAGTREPQFFGPLTRAAGEFSSATDALVKALETEAKRLAWAGAQP